ncbi:MAG TPA: type II toxin-antitoxin system VapC family toxin [Microthrixaceae bacterium]|nr:type II toxin-antitoxin system VapC family toxin [Microthrixaceae bacterium]
MTVVVDASAVVALLAAKGAIGDWVANTLGGHRLCAPHLLHPEVANTLRRHVLRGDLSDDAATLAHGDLVELPVELWPYEPLADRVWELRSSVTAYDATYVALAELLGVPLVTLDLRLARGHALRCTLLTSS